ncbi:hypothetical protein BFL38_10685 [Brachyspira hampsonii]|uniref:Uncharacterized protein n=1 Tax=Brachyspira hampsonii TaxID=1287055 RepID=A0A1E5NID0_9SPIR|nr:hypothetical protein [Brachyspira hampsonii]OEJ15915.1 hypothetical protein BFL38_10685 [Brachyspira hampsonii]
MENSIKENISNTVYASVNENNSKYDELINQLGVKTEDNKKEIDSLNTRFEEVREEQTKFLKEEKENLNNLKEELSNSVDEKIDEKIEKNNTTYNSIALEHNLKTFKELYGLKKVQKDLEDSILVNNSKYDELINQLGVKTEDNKKEIDILTNKLEESRDEQTKFLEEEKENLNNLKEELSNSVDEKIDERIEKNNSNYNSIMLEQNLKNFKEISDLRKNYKDLENSIKENISNTVYASVNENNSKYDELIYQLGVKTEDN